jgi:hypothetical protein
MKYVNKIGYEVEGLWSNNYHYLAEKIGGDFIEDGSVNFDYEERMAGMEMEYRSNPRKTIKDIERDLKEIAHYFISGNETCGFHVHLSCKRRSIVSLLASWKFIKYFLKEIKKLYPEMYKKRAENSYCRTSKVNKEQVICYFFTGDGDRYRAVNLLSYRKHRTIEFRLFDMMEVKNCIKYIKSTKEIVEHFIEDELKKNKKIEAIVKSNNDEVKKVFEIKEKVKIKQQLNV